MKCPNCGAELSDDMVFCPYCGTKLKDPSQNVVKGENKENKTIAGDQILTEMKCPNCGAPLNPLPGESIVVCSYCGTTVFLNPNGSWAKIKKHLILDIKVPDSKKALEILHNYMDSSILHRHKFEKSTILSSDVSYVPYWIIKASFVANFVYLKLETTNFGGRMIVTEVPVPGMETGEVYVPVIGKKDLREYQPEDYQFSVFKAREIKESDVNGRIKLLNGDVRVDEVENYKNNFVINFVNRQIRKK